MSEAIDWLMAGDPSIRWQTLRDLLDAAEPDWARERARVETEGHGARLLAAQDPDGQWDGGAFLPSGFEPGEWETVGQPWTATSFVLSQLRELGIDPRCEAMRRTVAQVGSRSRWDHAGEPFWDGETEECINGRLVADGAYFGVDVGPVVERLLSDRQPDGGWNCERERGSVRSSFHSTINVLEGLLEFERATGGTPTSRAARATGERFLLERGLFRRLGTGRPAHEQFLRLTHPNRWHYDVLRGLDYFRAAGGFDRRAPDPRLADAIAWTTGRRRADDRWPLDHRPPGRDWLALDPGPGRPSRWITLRAMRVLRWYERA